MVIDLDNDDCPSYRPPDEKKNSGGSQRSVKPTFSLNPLALILREEEITSFYKSLLRGNSNKRQKTEEKTIEKYIVNVNYAGGDERMSSCTRAIVTCEIGGEGHRLVEEIIREQKMCIGLKINKFEFGATNYTSEQARWIKFLGVVVEN